MIAALLLLATCLVQAIDVPERLIGTRELAGLLGVSQRQALRIGSRVPFFRIGRQKRWNPTEVLAALREEPKAGR